MTTIPANRRRLAVRAGDLSALTPAEVRVLLELRRWTVPPREEELNLVLGVDWWLGVVVDLEEYGYVEILAQDKGGVNHGDVKLTDAGRGIVDALTPPRAEALASEIDALRRERELRSRVRRIKRSVGKTVTREGER